MEDISDPSNRTINAAQMVTAHIDIATLRNNSRDQSECTIMHYSSFTTHLKHMRPETLQLLVVVNRLLLHLPMNKKNMSKPNSRIDALSVRPRICSPFECRDSLNIRNTRTKRITRRMASDMAWFVDLSCESESIVRQFVSCVFVRACAQLFYLWTDWRLGKVQCVLLFGHNGCQRYEIRNDGDNIDYIHHVSKEV